MQKYLQSNNFERLFHLLVSNYQNKVIRFVSLYVNDRLVCEELASDVFISLWTRWESLSDIVDIEKYIFIVAKNKAIDYLRKEQKETIDIDSQSIDAFHYTETTPESTYLSKEMTYELNMAINELPHRTKQTFLLIREQKKTYKEAAEILSVSVKTIEKQLANAVEKLKEKLMNKRS